MDFTKDGNLDLIVTPLGEVEEQVACAKELCNRFLDAGVLCHYYGPGRKMEERIQSWKKLRARNFIVVDDAALEGRFKITTILPLTGGLLHSHKMEFDQLVKFHRLALERHPCHFRDIHFFVRKRKGHAVKMDRIFPGTLRPEERIELREQLVAALDAVDRWIERDEETA